MRRRVDILSSTDWLSVFFYVVLVVFGWMNIYAVNLSSDNQFHFDLTNRYSMQILWMLVCAGIAITLFLVDSRFFSFMSYGFYGISIILLLAVLVVGHEVNNSRSWISLGGFSIQPSEFAKLGTMLALSRYLSGYNIKSSSLKSIVVSLGIVALPALFILLQPDVGSMMVFVAFLLVLYRFGLPGWVLLVILYIVLVFLGTLTIPGHALLLLLVGSAIILYFILEQNLKNGLLAIIVTAGSISLTYILEKIELLTFNIYLNTLVGVGIAVLVALIIAISKKQSKVFIVIATLITFIGFTYSVGFVFDNVMKEHQQKRVKIMLGLESDPYGYEYNVRQSKIAIGSGGFSGKGFLQGTQTKYKFVPEQSTDFIFCTVGEEWGFLGSFFFVVVFIGFLIRLIVVAERQRAKFSKIFGYCVVSILFFHFGVNIAMTIGLFPVIGIPLPFISYGGSSLMAFTTMVFIFLRLDATRKFYLI